MCSSLPKCQEAVNSTQLERPAHWKCRMETSTNQCVRVSALAGPAMLRSETAGAGSAAASAATTKRFQGLWLLVLCQPTTGLSLMHYKKAELNALMHYQKAELNALMHYQKAELNALQEG